MQAIERDGLVVFGPRAWVPRVFSKRAMNHGSNVSLRVLPPPEPIILQDGARVVGVRETKPDRDQRTEELVGPGLQVEEDHVSSTWAKQPRNLPLFKKTLIREVKGRCQATILAHSPEFRQRNAAMGILDPTERQEIADFIKNARTTCHQAEAGIMNATTHAEAVAVADAVFVPETP